MRTIGYEPSWRKAATEAALICLFVLGAFFSWFTLADRSVIFLYGHVAQGIPRTQPFDAMTSSRYWMAGLVVTGAVMVVYAAVYGVSGRMWGRRPPPWPLVWGLCAPPLAIGIPLITMATNTPTLPWALAAASTLTTLAGLAFALWPATQAAQCPRNLVWLIADGAGLLPALLLLRVVEFPNLNPAISMSSAVRMAIGSLVASAAWLFVTTVVRVWKRTPVPSTGSIVAIGLAAYYLLLPLLHYAIASPGYRYITDSSNVFALSITWQLLTFLAVYTLASATTFVRRRISRTRELTS